MQVHDVEQGSEAWFSARAGIPTASEFKRIVTSKGDASKQLGDYAAQLAAELYAGRPLDRFEGNAATERGHELEAEARLSYEFIHSLEVQQVGFVTNHGAGASPDGTVGSDGLLEIKCQLAKNHVQTLAHIARWKTCPADYIPQARGQMFICDRAWVDLLFYHPSLPEALVRIERDAKFDLALLAQINATIAERDALVELLGTYA